MIFLIQGTVKETGIDNPRDIFSLYTLFGKYIILNPFQCAVLEYLEVMPEASEVAVSQRAYSRLLPKQEAPGAVIVASIAWIFVAGFMAAYVALDMTNIRESIKIFCKNSKILMKRLIRRMI